MAVLEMPRELSVGMTSDRTIITLVLLQEIAHVKGRYVFNWGVVGRGILEIFCEKGRGPPTSQIRLMHDPSQIPKQKHLTLPPPTPRQKQPEVKITDRKCCSHNLLSRETWPTM